MAAGVFLSSSVDVSYQQIADYHSLCDQYLILISSGQFDVSEEILKKFGRQEKLVNQYKPFDGLLESLMEAPLVPNRDEKIDEMCRQLNQSGFETDFSKVCQLAARIRLNDPEKLLELKDHLDALKRLAKDTLGDFGLIIRLGCRDYLSIIETYHAAP